MEEENIKIWLRAFAEWLQTEDLLPPSLDQTELVDDFCKQDPEYQKQYGEWEPEERPEDHDGYAHPDPWDTDDDGEGEGS